MARDTATGLTVRGSEFEYTTLRRRGRGRYAPVASQKFTLRDKAGKDLDILATSDTDTPAMISGIRAGLKKIEQPISIALPAGQVLLRVATLPTSDNAELASMAQLQVDKLSPFSAENTVMSHEVLAQSATASSVLLAVSQLKPVAQLGTILANAKVFPQRVDVATLCWHRLLMDADELAKQGCQITILRDTSAYDLVVTVDQVPVLFRSLGNEADVTDQDVYSEIEYVLTTLEAEHGVGEIERLLICHWGDEPTGLGTELANVVSAEVAVKPFTELPPLCEGLARRSLDEDRSCINLAVEGWGEAASGRRLRNKLVTASAAILLIWLGTLGALFGSLRMQNSEIAKLKDEGAGLSRPAARAREMRDMLQLWDRYTNERYSAKTCLDEISWHLPHQPGRDASRGGPMRGITELKAVTYDNDQRKMMKIRGEAMESTSVYNYQEALQKSQYFADVKLDGPRRLSTGRQSFTIAISLPSDGRQTRR